MTFLVNFGYIAGIGAIVLSTVSVLTCAVAVPILFARLSTMKGKVVRDVAAFKVKVEQASIGNRHVCVACNLLRN